MTQSFGLTTIENGTELRAVHARLHATWRRVLDDGQTPCCYALSKHHILLRVLEKFLDLFPRTASGKAHSRSTVTEIS